MLSSNKPFLTTTTFINQTLFRSDKQIPMAKKSSASDIQPEINIGLVGHVDHGKTTLVKALSGRWTDIHSEEMKRGITIRLGYADATFYQCTKCKGPEGFGLSEKCPSCKGAATLLRSVSFVDAPGHESLMATMLAGSTMMDGALLLVSATESCPQPQTREHLAALEIVGIKNVIVVQNKIDVVEPEKAKKNYEQIKAFLNGTAYQDAPIIPISAMHHINIDVLIQTIQETIPTPERDPKADCLFYVARSFDINKPGSDPTDLKGGILGGAVKQGTFAVGDEIEILPGYEKGKQWKPLTTTVTGLMTGGQPVKNIHPGGSVALLTELDPSIVKSDKLTGAVVGKKGKLPPTWDALKLKTHLLERVVGSKDDVKIDPIRKNEILMLNVNSAATVGIVQDTGKKKFSCTLKRPVCAEVGSRVTISRRVGNRFRLIGYGIIE